MSYSREKILGVFWINMLVYIGKKMLSQGPVWFQDEYILFTPIFIIHPWFSLGRKQSIASDHVTSLWNMKM